MPIVCCAPQMFRAADVPPQSSLKPAFGLTGNMPSQEATARCSRACPCSSIRQDSTQRCLESA